MDGMDAQRKIELRAILTERQREISAEILEKLRDNRDQSSRRRQESAGLEDIESSDSVQEDIELALIEMRANTLAKVNEALQRLEEGNYGNCFECGKEIAENRLRALPFAVRCKNCEEAREVAEQRERELALRRGSAARMLFVRDDESLF